MSIEASMAGYYAGRAPEYERIYHKPERQADLAELRKLLESAFSGLHVFEVACGTGYWTEIISRSAASILATDINDEVLTIARSKSIDPPKVTFHKADAYAPPSALQKFTAGFSGFWWSHIPKNRIREFLQNFHRALAPGAKIVFIDNVHVEGSSTPISRTDDRGNTYQLRRLDDGSTHEVLKNFPTESDLRASTESFASNIRINFLHYYWILSYELPEEPT